MERGTKSLPALMAPGEGGDVGRETERERERGKKSPTKRRLFA
jgi:hypothetical protein